jgi:hypothetical protein
LSTGRTKQATRRLVATRSQSSSSSLKRGSLRMTERVTANPSIERTPYGVSHIERRASASEVATTASGESERPQRVVGGPCPGLRCSLRLPAPTLGDSQRWRSGVRGACTSAAGWSADAQVAKRCAPRQTPRLATRAKSVPGAKPRTARSATWRARRQGMAPVFARVASKLVCWSTKAAPATARTARAAARRSSAWRARRRGTRPAWGCCGSATAATARDWRRCRP